MLHDSAGTPPDAGLTHSAGEELEPRALPRRPMHGHARPAGPPGPGRWRRPVRPDPRAAPAVPVPAVRRSGLHPRRSRRSARPRESSRAGSWASLHCVELSTRASNAGRIDEAIAAPFRRSGPDRRCRAPTAWASRADARARRPQTRDGRRVCRSARRGRRSRCRRPSRDSAAPPNPAAAHRRRARAGHAPRRARVAAARRGRQALGMVTIRPAGTPMTGASRQSGGDRDHSVITTQRAHCQPLVQAVLTVTAR